MDVSQDLRADCARCDGLCCVSLPFDRSPWFAFDKAADTPCRHLLPTNRCAIHRARGAMGQSGCVHYECYGAGQRVTEDLFCGVSWRSDPEVAPAIFEAFRTLKQVHEMRLLLREARRLDLTRERAQRRDELLAELEPSVGFSAEELRSLDIERLQNEVRKLLRSLRGSMRIVAKNRRRLPLAR